MHHPSIWLHYYCTLMRYSHTNIFHHYMSAWVHYSRLSPYFSIPINILQQFNINTVTYHTSLCQVMWSSGGLLSFNGKSTFYWLIVAFFWNCRCMVWFHTRSLPPGHPAVHSFGLLLESKTLFLRIASIELAFGLPWFLIGIREVGKYYLYFIKIVCIFSCKTKKLDGTI